jgi:hypothetical protein
MITRMQLQGSMLTRNQWQELNAGALSHLLVADRWPYALTLLVPKPMRPSALRNGVIHQVVEVSGPLGRPNAAPSCRESSPRPPDDLTTRRSHLDRTTLRRITLEVPTLPYDAPPCSVSRSRMVRWWVTTCCRYPLTTTRFCATGSGAQ